MNRSKLSWLSSEKDRAENVMVVDLVSNDLSKICETDSVKGDRIIWYLQFRTGTPDDFNHRWKTTAESTLERNDSRHISHGLDDRSSKKTCS